MYKAIGLQKRPKGMDMQTLRHGGIENTLKKLNSRLALFDIMSICQ